MHTHVCPLCKKSFDTKRKIAKFCSYSCSATYNRSYTHKPSTPESLRATQKKWKDNNRERLKEVNKKYRIDKAISDPDWTEYRRQANKKSAYKHRISVIAAYGGAICSCDHEGKPCGPHPIEFLAIDHVNGDGKHKDARAGTVLYRKLKKLGYPPGYRVLCHNCNIALGFYGKCPMSKTEKQELRHRPRMY
jgi:hypothetical protein